MAVCGNVAEQFEINSFGGGEVKRDNSRGLEWGRGCLWFIKRGFDCVAMVKE